MLSVRAVNAVEWQLMQTARGEARSHTQRQSLTESNARGHYQTHEQKSVSPRFEGQLVSVSKTQCLDYHRVYMKTGQNYRVHPVLTLIFTISTIACNEEGKRPVEVER